MIPSEKEISELIEKQIPGFQARGLPQPLKGGNLNHLWRLRGKDRSLIIKVAPPHIASNPDVPLSPERIAFEAKAIQLFQPENSLQNLINKKVSAPKCFFFDHDRHLLIMEDVGELPNIAQHLRSEPASSGLGSALGLFIGRLHRSTFNNTEFRQHFNNQGIQKTRMSVQYEPAWEYTNIDQHDEIKAKTVGLGRDLLKQGKCLVMGDLWPPSILVDRGNIRLIDWEFCHYGRPLQDIGHFAAHCWMQAHVSDTAMKVRFKKLWLDFWESYQKTLGTMFSILINPNEITDAATHIGAEILVRANGPFKDSYVYRSCDTDHQLIKEAVQKARLMILQNNISLLWD